MFVGAMHAATVYALQNTGSAACSLAGFPILNALTGSSQSPLALSYAHMLGMAAHEVMLAPGARAGLVLEHVTDPDKPVCAGEAPTFEVSLPGWSEPVVTPPAHFTICPGINWTDVYVSPILPSPNSPTPYTTPQSGTATGAQTSTTSSPPAPAQTGS